MDVIKTYYFYAAHRNKEAGVKCGRIHGHTYDVECHFTLDMDGDLTVLFSDIDKIVEPIVKQYDHYFILHDEDPLCQALIDLNEPFIPLPFQTSAENMAMHIFDQIKEHINITRIVLAETKSSKVAYEKVSH